MDQKRLRSRPSVTRGEGRWVCSICAKTFPLAEMESDETGYYHKPTEGSPLERCGPVYQVETELRTPSVSRESVQTLMRNICPDTVTQETLLKWFADEGIEVGDG